MLLRRNSPSTKKSKGMGLDSQHESFDQVSRLPKTRKNTRCLQQGTTLYAMGGFVPWLSLCLRLDAEDN